MGLVAVVELVDTLDCDSRGYGFKSHQSPQILEGEGIMTTDWQARAYELECDLELAKSRHRLAAGLIEDRGVLSDTCLAGFAAEFRRWAEQEGYNARMSD